MAIESRPFRLGGLVMRLSVTEPLATCAGEKVIKKWLDDCVEILVRDRPAEMSLIDELQMEVHPIKRTDMGGFTFRESIPAGSWSIYYGQSLQDYPLAPEPHWFHKSWKRLLLAWNALRYGET